MFPRTLQYFMTLRTAKVYRWLLLKAISNMLTGFIKILSDADLRDSILPTMEKALLRSPEYSLPSEHLILHY